MAAPGHTSVHTRLLLRHVLPSTRTPLPGWGQPNHAAGGWARRAARLVCPSWTPTVQSGWPTSLSETDFHTGLQGWVRWVHGVTRRYVGGMEFGQTLADLPQLNQG